jgi:hypothetical protein
MRISEFDLAEALSADWTRIPSLVAGWKKRESGKGFNPYGQLPKNVLSGDLNRSQRTQILSKILGYKPRMLPERNHALTKNTWELFDSMGGALSGRESYSFELTGLEVKISAGYLYQLPDMEYVIVNWARKKAPSEKLVRAVLEVLHMTRPAEWSTNRVPALLIADAQDLRVAGPVAPANIRRFDERVNRINSIAG